MILLVRIMKLKPTEDAIAKSRAAEIRKQADKLVTINPKADIDVLVKQCQIFIDRTITEEAVFADIARSRYFMLYDACGRN
jgi:ribosomal protein L17